jgi:hypothetical protein
MRRKDIEIGKTYKFTSKPQGNWRGTDLLVEVVDNNAAYIQEGKYYRKQDMTGIKVRVIGMIHGTALAQLDDDREYLIKEREDNEPLFKTMYMPGYSLPHLEDGYRAGDEFVVPTKCIIEELDEIGVQMEAAWEINNRILREERIIEKENAELALFKKAVKHGIEDLFYHKVSSWSLDKFPDSKRYVEGNDGIVYDTGWPIQRSLSNDLIDTLVERLGN